MHIEDNGEPPSGSIMVALFKVQNYSWGPRWTPCHSKYVGAKFRTGFGGQVSFHVIPTQMIPLLGWIFMHATHPPYFSGNVDLIWWHRHSHWSLVGEQPTGKLTLGLPNNLIKHLGSTMMMDVIASSLLWDGLMMEFTSKVSKLVRKKCTRGESITNLWGSIVY